MNVRILKTHAKGIGNSLYKAGQVWPQHLVEDLDYKLKEGYCEFVKEEKIQVKTKEEKATRKTKKK